MSVDEEAEVKEQQPVVAKGRGPLGQSVVNAAIGEPNSLDELSQSVQADLDAEAVAKRQARNKRKALRRMEQTKRTKRKASRKARKVTRQQNRS